MNNNQIDVSLNSLQVGSLFNTPDNTLSVPFSIAAITANEIHITLGSGNPLTISRLAFIATNDFLQNNGHNINNPVRISSSNGENVSGPLCSATKAVNGGTRCINYIVPILTQIGAVEYSGNRPNTCWHT